MRIIKIAGRLPVSGHDKYGLVGTLITINDIYRSVLLILLDFCVLFLFFFLSEPIFRLCLHFTLCVLLSDETRERTDIETTFQHD